MLEFRLCRCLFFFSSGSVDYRAEDEADDERDNPAETVRRKRCGSDDSFGKAEAGKTGQGFEECVYRHQIDRSLVSTVIGDDADQDAQNQQSQAGRVADAENPAYISDDAVYAKKGRKRGKNTADDGYLTIRETACGLAGEFGYGCNLADSRRTGLPDDGYRSGCGCS